MGIIIFRVLQIKVLLELLSVTITITKNVTKTIPKTVMITNKVENSRMYNSGKQKYSRLRCLLHVKGLVIFFIWADLAVLF